MIYVKKSVIASTRSLDQVMWSFAVMTLDVLTLQRKRKHNEWLSRASVALRAAGTPLTTGPVCKDTGASIEYLQPNIF